jgi:hypothetical protein
MVVFVLILFVPTIFIAIRRAYFPPTFRRDRPTWVLLFGVFGPAVIIGIAAAVAWWLQSIWAAIVGIALFQLIRLVRHRL